MYSSQPDTPIVVYTEECGFSIPDHFRSPKWAKMGARRTDRIIIGFGNQFSAYREFGNEAISEIINDNKLEILKLVLLSLPKQKQKYLLRRCKYIFDSGYYCYPLTKSGVDKALSLFLEFVSEHNCKC